jgi:hypothetical protein
MRKLVSLITDAGDWLVSLSDRARMQLVLACLLLLIGGGVYKLINSIERLNEPLPVATPEQLIKPMEKLFEGTKDDLYRYHQDKSQLDSLKKAYSTQTGFPQ